MSRSFSSYFVVFGLLGIMVAGASSAMAQSLEAVAFEPREAALIDLARRANRTPHAITDAYFHTLRETGAQDAEIVEALGVMEVFAAFNRFLDSLQVDVDF